MVVSPVNQVWPKSYCKAQCEREEDKADIKRSGKTAYEIVLGLVGSEMCIRDSMKIT